MKPVDLELDVEELVLHGFAPGDRYRIREAVERELVRLFTEQDAPRSLAQSGEIARLEGGEFEVKLGSKAEDIGIQVAQAVHEGMSI
jgi:hypothetical protein